MLRKLGMIDGEGVVQIKGKAACEIDTADELLATELMLDGTFSGLDKHQLVALVSCLVPGEKSQVGPQVNPRCDDRTSCSPSASSSLMSRISDQLQRLLWQAGQVPMSALPYCEI